MSPQVYAFFLHLVGITLLGSFFLLLGLLLAALLWYRYKNRAETITRDNAKLAQEHERLQAEWNALKS